jgi:hypothetical protein
VIGSFTSASFNAWYSIAVALEPRGLGSCRRHRPEPSQLARGLTPVEESLRPQDG